MEELYTENEIKEDICKAMVTLYHRGLISALGGNISARIPGVQEFWITPSGIFKGELTTEDLLKVDLEGNVIEGVMKPSFETPMHRAIYNKRPDVNAIIHAHNPVTTGLALAGIPIQPITIEAVTTLRKVPVVPFVFPGTDELANAVAEHILGVRALVLQNHGVIGVGYNMLEAETVVETLEEVSMTQFVAYHFGKPPLVPEKDIELAKKLYKF